MQPFEGKNSPSRVIDGSEDSTVLRVAKLGDQERSRSVGNGDSKTEEETSNSNCCPVGGGAQAHLCDTPKNHCDSDEQCDRKSAHQIRRRVLGHELTKVEDGDGPREL